MGKGSGVRVIGSTSNMSRTKPHSVLDTVGGTRGRVPRGHRGARTLSLDDAHGDPKEKGALV